MPDYPKLIKEQERELLGLHGRMDDDRKLLYLNKYIMKDALGEPVKGLVNVTLNMPAVFASNVISALNSTRQQIVVDSDDSKIKTSEIEDFLNSAFASANQLAKRSVPLNMFTDVQTCIRGRAARRVLFRIEEGKLIPDIASLDTRFLTGEAYEWYGYKTYRSKADIEAEYGIVIASKYAWVSDVWDKTHNEVWVSNDRIKLNKEGIPRVEEHGYGFVPLVEEIVPLGYGNILLDDDRLKYEGESIFFMIRDIVPELNRWISVLQTLHLKTVKPPMKQKIKGGGAPSEYDDVTGTGAITAIDEGEDIARIDYGDAIRATELVYQAIEKAKQEGSYTDIDIGNVRQPFSAVALITIGESKDQVYLPRLATRELLNKATADMLIKQVIQEAKANGMSEIELGTPGHKRKFKISDLEGEYETTFKNFLKSPKTDIARMAVATQAENFYDPETILEDVLQAEDPKAIMRKRYYFMAEKIDPNILKRRVLMNLLEIAEDGDEDAEAEAKILAMSMGVTLEQIKQGNIMPPPSPSGNGGRPNEPLVPLLGKGGQVGGIPREAIRAAGPEEEVTE